MRIAFIFISMPVGGAEDFALCAAAGLPAGIEPVFVCLRSLGIIGEELQREGRVHLVNAAPGKRLNLPGIVRLARWLKAQRIDVVHSQTYHAHIYSVPAARLAGIASVVHQQKTLEKLPFHRSLFMRCATKMASHVVALSTTTRDDLRKTFRLPAAKLSVVPNAVDRERFQPAADPAAIRARLGLGSGFLCGSIASLNTVKNHAATVRAYVELAKRGREFNGVFIGEGGQRRNLEEQIAAGALENRVRLVGNQRPVLPWLQSLDLLVMPSHWEGQPMILLQALACQIPVLASRIEGNLAVLGDAHPGLFDPGDESQYQALLDRAACEPAFRQCLLAAQQTLPIPDSRQIGASLGALYQSLHATPAP